MKLVFLKKNEYIVKEDGELSIKQRRDIDNFKELIQCEIIIKKYEKEKQQQLKKMTKLKEKNEILQYKLGKANLKIIKLKKVLMKRK